MKRRFNTKAEIAALKRIQKSNPNKRVYISAVANPYKLPWVPWFIKDLQLDSFSGCFYSLKRPKAPVLKF